MRRLSCAVLLAATLLLLPACSSGSSTGAAAYSGYGTPGSVKPSTSSPLAPGRSAKRGGRVELVGTLQRDDGGRWIVVGAVPSQASAGHIIGVIVNPSSLSGVNLAGLDNAYVRVTGTASGGIATDANDLGVIADTVKKVSAQ